MTRLHEKHDEYLAWLAAQPVTENEPEKPAETRDWRGIGSSIAELTGIGAIAAGFGWFSPGLGLMAGGAGLVVVGFLVGLPGKAGP